MGFFSRHLHNARVHFSRGTAKVKGTSHIVGARVHIAQHHVGAAEKRVQTHAKNAKRGGR